MHMELLYQDEKVTLSYGADKDSKVDYNVAVDGLYADEAYIGFTSHYRGSRDFTLKYAEICTAQVAEDELEFTEDSKNIEPGSQVELNIRFKDHRGYYFQKFWLMSMTLGLSTNCKGAELSDYTVIDNQTISVTVSNCFLSGSHTIEGSVEFYKEKRTIKAEFYVLPSHLGDISFVRDSEDCSDLVKEEDFYRVNCGDIEGSYDIEKLAKGITFTFEAKDQFGLNHDVTAEEIYEYLQLKNSQGEIVPFSNLTIEKNLFLVTIKSNYSGEYRFLSSLLSKPMNKLIVDVRSKRFNGGNTSCYFEAQPDIAAPEFGQDSDIVYVCHLRDTDGNSLKKISVKEYLPRLGCGFRRGTTKLGHVKAHIKNEKNKEGAFLCHVSGTHTDKIDTYSIQPFVSKEDGSNFDFHINNTAFRVKGVPKTFERLNYLVYGEDTFNTSKDNDHNKLTLYSHSTDLTCLDFNYYDYFSIGRFGYSQESVTGGFITAMISTADDDQEEKKTEPLSLSISSFGNIECIKLTVSEAFLKYKSDFLVEVKLKGVDESWYLYIDSLIKDFEDNDYYHYDVQGDNLRSLSAGEKLSVAVDVYDKNRNCVHLNKDSPELKAFVEKDEQKYVYDFHIASRESSKPCPKYYQIVVPDDEIYTETGLYDIVVSKNREALYEKIQRVTVGAADAANFKYAFKASGKDTGPHTSVQLDKEFEINISSKDSYGNKGSNRALQRNMNLLVYNSKGEQVFTVLNEHTYSVKASEVTYGEVQYKLSFAKPEKYSLVLWYSGQKLGQIAEVDIQPGDCRQFYLDTDTTIKHQVHDEVSFTIHCLDRSGTKCTTGGSDFAVMIQNYFIYSVYNVPGTIVDMGNGEYRLRFKAEKVGNYYVNVWLKGENSYSQDYQLNVGY